MLVRPMRDEDVEDAQVLSGAAAAALPAGPWEDEPPGPRTDAAAARWHRRARHLLGTDPGGAWVAQTDEGVLAGVAMALRRDGLWGLSSLYVRPGLQGAGVGRALMERATAYGGGALRGLICASHDPRAVRLYRVFGLRLHPAMTLRGAVDRTALPVVRHVREGWDGDFADAVDRMCRGAVHGPDHAHLAAESTGLLAETSTGRGYAYLRDGEPNLVAATDVPTARELLWEALARTAPGAPTAVDDLTAEQVWAVDIGIAAGLSVLNAGFVCVRGMRPPTPYVPSGAFL